jgi:hypothetical protein
MKVTKKNLLECLYCFSVLILLCCLLLKIIPSEFHLIGRCHLRATVGAKFQDPAWNSLLPVSKTGTAIEGKPSISI